MLMDFALLCERLKVLLVETSQSHFLQANYMEKIFDKEENSVDSPHARLDY